jgi:hypothetical protein
MTARLAAQRGLWVDPLEEPRPNETGQVSLVDRLHGVVR